MGKGKGLTFTIFATLGALVGYASYMASKNEFSEETINRYDTFLNKAKNVGTDIQRTYTSIGDKQKFTANTKNLGESAKKLAGRATDLVASASGDMFRHAREQVGEVITNAKNSLVSANTNNSKSTSNSKPKKAVKKKTKTSKKKK